MRKTSWAFIAGIVLAGCTAAPGQKVTRPEAFGLTCVTATVCVQDTARRARALALHAGAVAFVEQRLGAFKTTPRVSFCSTKACFAQFAPERARGVAFGTYGIVINATGWQDYVVRHEMIHHWQSERFGIVRTEQVLPKWYVEGMAYALSGDPRRVLPNPRTESYRQQFRAWVAAGNDWRTPPG